MTVGSMFLGGPAISQSQEAGPIVQNFLGPPTNTMKDQKSLACMGTTATKSGMVTRTCEDHIQGSATPRPQNFRGLLKCARTV